MLGLCNFLSIYKAFHNRETHHLQSMKPPVVLVAVNVLLIVSFTDSGFIKPVNGQKVITGDNIKFKDCSKYIH